MASEIQDPRPRDLMLRGALVATVAASPYSTRGSRKKAALAAAIAFVIGGALTGGVVSSAAFASVSHDRADRSVAYAGHDFVGTHGTLLGTPVEHSGSDDATLNLGSAPTGADHIVIAFQCLDAGTFTQSIDGTSNPGTETCSKGGPEAGEYTFTRGGQHILSVTSAGSEYAVWASWVKETPIPKPSTAQKSAIADGRVSRAEYLASFNRYSGCMSGQGFPLGHEQLEANEISYVTTDAQYDADRICYPLEFKQVGMMWAREHSKEAARWNAHHKKQAAAGITWAGQLYRAR